LLGVLLANLYLKLILHLKLKEEEQGLALLRTRKEEKRGAQRDQKKKWKKNMKGKVGSNNF